MTRLRWSNSPRETDPAYAQRDRQVFWPRSSPRKDPRGDLFNRCLKAKKRYERACADRDKIERRLKSYLSVEAKAANSDRRRIARGLKPESSTTKAGRAAQIEQAKQQLAKAEAAITSTRDEHQRLTRLWQDAQPT